MTSIVDTPKAFDDFANIARLLIYNMHSPNKQTYSGYSIEAHRNHLVIHLQLSQATKSMKKKESLILSRHVFPYTSYHSMRIE